MLMRRFLYGQSPLKRRVRGVAFLCFILLLSGCGGEESVDDPAVETTSGVTPNEATPVSTRYFPMAVDNRWVYRNPDGSEWSRTITRKETQNGRDYYVFNYEPPIHDWGFAFLQNPKYAAAADSVILSITEADLNQVLEQVFDNRIQPWLRGDMPRLVKRRDPLLLNLPLFPGQQWLALDIRFIGGYDASYYVYAYEARGVLLGGGCRPLGMGPG